MDTGRRRFVRVTGFGDDASSDVDILTRNKDGLLEGRKRLLNREMSSRVSTIGTTFPSRISTVAEFDLNLSGSSLSSNERTRTLDGMPTCRSSCSLPDTRSTLERVHAAERTSAVTLAGRVGIARYSKQVQPCLVADGSTSTLRRDSCWVNGYRKDFRLQKKNLIEYQDPRDRIAAPRQTRKMSVLLDRKLHGMNGENAPNKNNDHTIQKSFNKDKKKSELEETLVVKPACLKSRLKSNEENKLDSILRKTSQLINEMNKENVRYPLGSTPRSALDVSKFNNGYKSYTQIVGRMRTRKPGMRNEWLNGL